MTENTKLCMGCMKEIREDAAACPHCGCNQNEKQLSPFLPLQIRLQGRYLVGKKMGIRSDCIDYIGYDTIEEKPVIIHEFFSAALASRISGETAVTVKEQFISFYDECADSFEFLWKTLRSAPLPAVEKVEDVFRENGTVYAVSRYEECITLEKFLKDKQKPMSQNMICGVFKPVFYALTTLNRASIIHANISLDSILIKPDGRLMLSSFSIPQTQKPLSPIYRQPAVGYAPIERFGNAGEITPSTDVYSLASVIYTCICGFVVNDARHRANEDSFTVAPAAVQALTPQALTALKRALEVFPVQRAHTVSELSRFFVKVDAPVAPTVPVPTAEPISEQAFETEPEEEFEAEEEPNAEQKEEKNENIVAIILKTFISTLIIVVIIFITLYVTVLYNKIEVPILDNLLSSVSFLPMNKQEEQTTTTLPETTTRETDPTEMVIVADFKRLEYESISQNPVFKENFNLEYAFEFSYEYEKNAIISQSIPSGDEVAKGTTIKLVVSRGKPTVTLRDVKGMDYSQAYTVLTADGFIVKKETVENNGSHKEGEIAEMSLVAGLSFEKGTEITLSVYGKDEEKTEKETEKPTQKSTQAEAEKSE